jgi:putative flippase GtrA
MRLPAQRIRAEVMRLSRPVRNWLDPRFVRFLFVGLLNTVFGYCAFAFLLFLGLHYALATLLSTIAGIIFNFNTTGRLVFGNRDTSRIVRFVGVYAFTYLLSVGGLRLAEMAGIDLYLAGAVLTAVLAVVSFLLFRHLVFSGMPKGTPGEGA